MKNIFVSLIIVLILSSFCFGEYTGLVIDAKNLGVEPGMSPKVYDNKGNEVYGTMYIDPETIAEKGIAQYAGSVQEAIDCGAVGKNPLVIKASAKGSNPQQTDVIVSEQDAKKIYDANAEADFFSDFKIAIII